MKVSRIFDYILCVLLGGAMFSATIVSLFFGLIGLVAFKAEHDIIGLLSGAGFIYLSYIAFRFGWESCKDLLAQEAKQ